jgi:hypothetical protein
MSQMSIVSASDRAIFGGSVSSDAGSDKQDSFAGEWQAMFSGNDITQAQPIIERAREYFDGRPNTLKEARSCFKRAVQDQIKEMATDRFLSRFSLDMPTFKKSGNKLLDSITFSAICNDIRSVNLGELQFLIWGFDHLGSPHIFIVGSNGDDFVYDTVGFASLGWGATAADVVLHYLNQSRRRDLQETIYSVCAAKFMAERAGVGRDTYLFAKTFGTVAFSHRNGLIEKVRELWEHVGAPRVPESISDTLKVYDIKCQTHKEAMDDLIKEFSLTQQPTTHDLQFQPALPESPEESGES